MRNCPPVWPLGDWGRRRGAMNAPQVCSVYEAITAPCVRGFGLMAAISGWGLLKCRWPLRRPSGFPRCDVGGLPHLVSTSGHPSALGLCWDDSQRARTDPAQTFVALASISAGSWAYYGMGWRSGDKYLLEGLRRRCCWIPGINPGMTGWRGGGALPQPPGIAHPRPCHNHPFVTPGLSRGEVCAPVSVLSPGEVKCGGAAGGCRLSGSGPWHVLEKEPRTASIPRPGTSPG
jgi:hypothetical protein